MSTETYDFEIGDRIRHDSGLTGLIRKRRYGTCGEEYLIAWENGRIPTWMWRSKIEIAC